MTPMIHERTLEQRTAALAHANHIRRRRAELKQRMRVPNRRLAAVGVAAPIVQDTPDWAATMLVRDLILALPLIGPAKTDRLLVSLRINPRKTLAGLSPRQRCELLDWLLAA